MAGDLRGTRCRRPYDDAPTARCPDDPPLACSDATADDGAEVSWRIFLSPPHVGERERELLIEAFDSNWIAPVGPMLDSFEEEIAAVAGRAHAVALSSGTAALHLGLLELGVRPGDEVICSDLTFAATANAIRYCSARPVFVDAERERWCMDPQLLATELEAAAARGALPAAIVPVDLYGTCADHAAIADVAARHDVPVLADAAESVGAHDADGNPAGSHGRAAVFSFNGNKIITGSGGGALLTDDEQLAARVKHLSTQAREPAVHYEHAEVGFNYRLSNLLAGLLRGQLENLTDRVARRRAIHRRYRERLGALPGISVHPTAAGSSTWLTQILVEPGAAGTSPEAIRLALAAERIEARPVWKPMSLQPVFADERVVGGDVGADLFARGLCLPSGSVMTDDEVDEVAAVVAAQVTGATQ